MTIAARNVVNTVVTFFQKLFALWSPGTSLLILKPYISNYYNFGYVNMPTSIHMNIAAIDILRPALTLYGHIKTAEQRTVIQQYSDWYSSRWLGGL